MPMKITRKAYLELWRDGVQLSRHVSLVECVEAASRETGTYQVLVGDSLYYEIVIPKTLTSTDGLVVVPAVPPLNDPPVWTSQPSISATFGVAQSWDLDDLATGHTSISLNTGSVALGSGWTWTPATAVLAYDGVGAIGTTSGHIATLSDGTDTTDSDPFSLSILDTWPQYGVQTQAGAMVAGIDTNILTEPYRTWNLRKDLIIIQGRYPTTSRVQTSYDAIVSMKAANSGFKILEYTNICREEDDTSKSNIGTIVRQVLSDAGAQSAWRNYDDGTNDYIRYRSSSAADDYRVNPAVTHTSPRGGYTNFAYAIADRYNEQSGSGAAVNLRNAFDGIFHDSMDWEDRFGGGGYRNETNPPDYDDGNPDYLKPNSSGGTNPTYYRKGFEDIVNTWNLTFPGDVHVRNGGRDESTVRGGGLIPGDANFDWKDFWDACLLENVDSKLGLEKVSGSNAMEISYSNPANRLEIFVSAGLINELFVNQTASNNLGKGVVILDFPFEWSGADPTDESDIPQAYYEAARFVCGLAALHDSWIAAPTLQRGSLPFPYMDEFVYDLGNPVGGTPSIGSIDTSTDDFVLTLRAADDGGFFWQEYDNGLWVSNVTNYPGGLNPYPQAGTDTCTLPSAGSGFHWEHAHSNYTNSSRTTGATQGQNQSALVNTGSLPDGTGLTLTMPRWHSRMLVRVAD